MNTVQKPGTGGPPTPTGTSAEVASSSRQARAIDVGVFVFDTLRTNRYSRIRQDDCVARWGEKSDEALAFWSTPQARQYFRKCVDYLNYGTESANWPDRTFEQVADIALWGELLVKNGTLSKPPAGDWLKAVEMALVAIELGPDSDIGHPEEHMRAGRLAADYIGRIFSDAKLAQKVQALIACSSNKGLHVEKVFTDPSAAEAKVKEFLYGAQPHFFKTTQERRDFAEALLIVKLSDMSRGTHGTDAKSLANDYLAGDRMVQELRRANGLSAQPPKVF